MGVAVAVGDALGAGVGLEPGLLGELERDEVLSGGAAETTILQPTKLSARTRTATMFLPINSPTFLF